MTRPWGRGWAGAVLGLLALHLMPSWSPAPGVLAQETLALVLREEETGRAFWCIPVVSQEEFVLEFLHSYDRFPVREHYKILGPDRILFQGLITKSVLNGQGFAAASAHTRSDGWLETDGEQAARDTVDFIMGTGQHADHRLLVHGKEQHLSEFVPPGTFVLVRAEPGNCTGLDREK